MQVWKFAFCRTEEPFYVRGLVNYVCFMSLSHELLKSPFSNDIHHDFNNISTVQDYADLHN